LPGPRCCGAGLFFPGSGVELNLTSPVVTDPASKNDVGLSVGGPVALARQMLNSREIRIPRPLGLYRLAAPMAERFLLPHEPLFLSSSSFRAH